MSSSCTRSIGGRKKSSNQSLPYKQPLSRAQLIVQPHIDIIIPRTCHGGVLSPRNAGKLSACANIFSLCNAPGYEANNLHACLEISAVSDLWLSKETNIVLF